MKPLLVIGGNGQLGKALRRLCPDAVFLDRRTLDLAHPAEVSEKLEAYDPCAVINAAAYTQVDHAEHEERLAITINGESPAAIAIYCASRTIPLVHFSSDYVFNGSGDLPWREEDVPCPLNAYGRSKLAGEEAITHIGGKYLILRTSWVYDAEGKNFLNTIVRLAAEREELKIVSDQYGAPTYAGHLARASLDALQNAMQHEIFPSGIYHLCNAGVTSWHGFASSIIAQAQQQGRELKVKTIIPIATADYPLPAARPANSRLDCSKIMDCLAIKMPDWQCGLTECMSMQGMNAVRPVLE